MAEDIRAHGGTFHTSAASPTCGSSATYGAVLLDTTPTQLLELAGEGRLPSGYARQLRRFHVRPRRRQGRLPGLGTHPLDQSGGRAGGHRPPGRQPRLPSPARKG